MKKTYDEVVEKLKKNKEVELYKFSFSKSGDLDFYIDKVYKAEDGEKITSSVIIAKVFGVKYKLDKIKCIGTALIKGESFIVKEYLTYDRYKSISRLRIDEINEYSFSITEAITERANDKSYLYFLGKDGSLYRFENEAKNKNDIELLLSKGLISKLEDFKE